MKRAFLATAVLCLLSLLLPLGLNGQVVTAISSMAINQYGQPSPSAIVRVCLVTAGGNPCDTTGVTLYYDYGQGIKAPNPYSADQYGNYSIYATGATTPNVYLVQVSPAPPQSGGTFSYLINGAGSGGSPSVVLSPPVYSVQGYLNALSTVSDSLININTTTHTLTAGNLLSNGNMLSQSFGSSGATQSAYWYYLHGGAVDACDAINKAGAALPSTGGIITMWDFPTGNYFCTTQITALANTPNSGHRVTLQKNPQVVLIFNTVSAAPCAVPIGDGSAIDDMGRNWLRGDFEEGTGFVGTNSGVGTSATDPSPARNGRFPQLP